MLGIDMKMGTLLAIFAIVVVACLAQSASASPINITTSNPTPNSTLSCLFSDAASIIDFIGQGSANATLLIATCPDACATVFGSGNPDISGKGLMISYITQAGMASLFGPILFIMELFVPTESPSIFLDAVNIGKNLRSPVCEINAFFCISVLVAAVVRYHQLPAVFEILFINSLISMQSYIVITVVVVFTYLMVLKRIEANWSFDIYSFLISIAQMATGYANEVPGSAFTTYYQLASECHLQRGYIDVSSYFAPAVDGGNSAKWWAIGIAIGIGWYIFVAVIACVFRGLWAWCKRIWLRYSPIWLQNNGLELLYSLFALCYVGTLVEYIVGLERIRSMIRDISGKDYHDDEFGYGQTTAVLLWAPVLRRAFIEIWQCYKTPRPPPVIDPGEELLPQSAPPVPPPVTPAATPQIDHQAAIPAAPPPYTPEALPQGEHPTESTSEDTTIASPRDRASTTDQTEGEQSVDQPSTATSTSLASNPRTNPVEQRASTWNTSFRQPEPLAGGLRRRET